MRSKYETNVEPYLDRIEAWARDGVSQKDIASNLGISESVFYKYIDQHEELKTALARTKDYVDNVVVVGAYLKRAVGYTTTETKRVYKFKKNLMTGEVEKVLDRVEEVDKHIPGDPRALENWLRFRQKDVWSALAEQVEQEVGIVEIPKRKPLEIVDGKGNEISEQ